MPQDKQMRDRELEEKKLEKPFARDSSVEGRVEDKEETKPAQASPSESKIVTDTNKSGDKTASGSEPSSKDKKLEPAVKSRKRSEAVVNGKDLRISTKQAVAICNFIKNKDVDKAISELGEVSKMKRAIPMKGEIPHRRGKGMMSGRYPLKAVAEFIRLLKNLKANAVNHEIELEKVKLLGMANVASRPLRRGGRKRFKRSHVQIKLIPRTKIKKDKKK